MEEWVRWKNLERTNDGVKPTTTESGRKRNDRTTFERNKRTFDVRIYVQIVKQCSESYSYRYGCAVHTYVILVTQPFRVGVSRSSHQYPSVRNVRMYTYVRNFRKKFKNTCVPTFGTTWSQSGTTDYDSTYVLFCFLIKSNKSMET